MGHRLYQRAAGNWPMILVTLIQPLALALFGCVSSEPKDLVGTYVGDYANGAHEVIVIREDGTFEQLITREGSNAIRNEGKWEISKPSVVFYDFVIGFQTKQPPDFLPHRVNVMRAAWHPESGRIVVSLYSELRKQSTGGTTPTGM